MPVIAVRRESPDRAEIRGGATDASDGEQEVAALVTPLPF